MMGKSTHGSVMFHGYYFGRATIYRLRMELIEGRSEASGRLLSRGTQRIDRIRLPRVETFEDNPAWPEGVGTRRYDLRGNRLHSSRGNSSRCG